MTTTDDLTLRTLRVDRPAMTPLQPRPQDVARQIPIPNTLGGLVDSDQPEPATRVQTNGSTTPEIPGRVLGLSFAVDEFGQYIVQEPLASTYGVGVTPQAAVADFRRAGWARLEVLARHRDQLSVRMAQELAALERIFRG